MDSAERATHVPPVFVSAPTSAPAFNRARTIWTRPRSAARCRAVQLAPTASLTSAPLAISSFTTSRSPRSHASRRRRALIRALVRQEWTSNASSGTRGKDVILPRVDLRAAEKPRAAPGAGAAATAGVKRTTAAAARATMHVGCQYFATDPASMQFLQRFGVSHIDVRVPDMELATLVRAREESAAFGITTELVHLPGGCARSIKLGLDGRDADIDEMCRAIENAGVAGLRGICWHFCVLANQRSEATPGRGGTKNSSLYAADYDNEELCEAAILNGGYVTRDEVFERIDYLLQRIVPVAERSKVQLCCHLSDPPAPVLRGVERWDWPVRAGIDRFLGLYDSPYHGMNLCCGTASEGMADPATELLPMVRKDASSSRG
jgi:hypothetical protein